MSDSLRCFVRLASRPAERMTCMPKALPRVASSDITADFVPLHDWLDTVLPRFRKSALGQAWPNVAAGRHDVSGRAYEVYCPFDRYLLVARLASGQRQFRHPDSGGGTSLGALD